MSIASYPVIAEFISPDAKKPILNEWSEKWIYDHVLQTQYCLQISKCSDINCCDAPKTSVFSVLNGRFLPPPVPFTSDISGPIVDEKNGRFGSLAARIICNALIAKETIFDSYCPSVKKDLKSRTCDDCGKYFATKKAKLSHRKSQVCKKSDEYLLETESEAEESDEEMDEDNNNGPGGLPIIDPSTDPDAYVNVFEHLKI
uniref:C2H2-type domain-containing protein n=1 Tax=Panagrolaimus superbus TaxID=310955 RepID=A0A914YJ77_9BILA